MTKKSADINYISKDLFPKTYNRTMIDDDYIKQLEQENKQLKEVIDKAKLYINSTKYSDITGLEKHSIKEFWFIEELLDILKEASD